MNLEGVHVYGLAAQIGAAKEHSGGLAIAGLNSKNVESAVVTNSDNTFWVQHLKSLGHPRLLRLVLLKFTAENITVRLTSCLLTEHIVFYWQRITQTGYSGSFISSVSKPQFTQRRQTSKSSVPESRYQKEWVYGEVEELSPTFQAD